MLLSIQVVVDELRTSVALVRTQRNGRSQVLFVRNPLFVEWDFVVPINAFEYTGAPSKSRISSVGRAAHS